MHRHSAEDSKLIAKWLRRNQPRRERPEAKPILKRSKPLLTERPPLPADPSGTWYVLRTTAKMERQAEGELISLGIDVYAPRAFSERFVRRRKVFITREEMLVPRYLFIRCNYGPMPWRAIRETKGVDQVLPAGNEPIALNTVETKALIEIIEADRDLAFDFTRKGKLHRKEIGRTKRDTARLTFAPGAIVRVKRGPFASFSAEVEEVTSRGTVEVLVSLFGRLSATEIPANWLELEEIAA